MHKALKSLLAATDLSKAARRLRVRGKVDLSSRLLADKFIREFLRDSSLTAEASYAGEAGRTVPMVVWLYWAEGFANAPAIVVACKNRMRLMNPSVTIIELDDASLTNYIQLPDYVIRKTGHDKTHFSDVLRCALLAEHGGIWADATCYSAQSIHSLCGQVTNGFFAYTRTDTYLLSSWFMASAPGNIIPRMLRDALFAYWQTADQLENYFWIHYLFEALHDNNEDFRGIWARRTLASSADAHFLQGRLADSFDQLIMDEVLALTPIQKLTYKIRMPQPGSNWHHICGRE